MYLFLYDWKPKKFDNFNEKKKDFYFLSLAYEKKSYITDTFDKMKNCTLPKLIWKGYFKKYFILKISKYGLLKQMAKYPLYKNVSAATLNSFRIQYNL